MNSSPICNCWRSKSAILFSRNINYNINSLLRICVGTHIIYIYIYISDERNIPEVVAPENLQPEELLMLTLMFLRTHVSSLYYGVRWLNERLGQMRVCRQLPEL